jgi:hypothetical protein
LGDCWGGQEEKEDERIEEMAFLESHGERLTTMRGDVIG